MIISHKRRYIFIHIPKTGGTSMALALEDRAAADDIMLGDTPKSLKRRHRVKNTNSDGRLWKHATLRDIHGLVSDEQIADYFTFTLVRNPWDRMVSYYHWLQDQSFDHAAVKISQSHDFSDFLAHPVIAQSIRESSYASYMTNRLGEEKCNLYLRLEHLSEDLPPLEEHLGFALTLPHVNRSHRDAGWRSYYSDQDAERVREMAKADIDRFGYQF